MQTSQMTVRTAKMTVAPEYSYLSQLSQLRLIFLPPPPPFIPFLELGSRGKMYKYSFSVMSQP